MSFLSTLGKDFKSVFNWVVSAKGQAVIGAGEAVVEALVPATTAIFTLANNWMTEIIKTESLAAAAGSQTGSGAQKAAAVISSVTPEVLQFATTYGLATPTAAQITTASTALVAFLNAFNLNTIPTPPPVPQQPIIVTTGQVNVAPVNTINGVPIAAPK